MGGALTTVFVGIAAQQALGDVFAGLVLQFARPFHAGDAIRLRAGALGGTLDGTVVEIGSPMSGWRPPAAWCPIPNSRVLNAVIGPIPPAEEDVAPAVVDGKSGTPGAPESNAASAAWVGLNTAKGWPGISPASPLSRSPVRGRLSAKGTTRLQPNGIPRRQ